MSNITRLRTKPEQLKTDQAKQLKLALEPFKGILPETALTAILYTVDRQTQTDQKGTFIMLKAEQNAIVVQYLAEKSKRPIQALRLWAILFNHVYPLTGQIMQTREQLAEQIGTVPEVVSKIMGELVAFNAIFSKRRRVAGMRGPGMVEYYMNKHVAEYMHRASEDELRQIPLPGFDPKVIEGGKS